MSTGAAVVTGGIQGLGAAITIVLLKRGYQVVVADIQEEKGKLFVKEQESVFGKGKILFFRCDVTKMEDYKNLFEFCLKEFKRVDVLVNNAGVICEDKPQLLLNINVMGPINGCQTALRYMGKSKGGLGGIVINTASIAGFIVHPEFAVYVASKHAVIGLTRSYGHNHHFEKEGIIFSAICPSYIDTPLLKHIDGGLAQKQIQDLKKANQLLCTEEVAEGINKLLDDKINGSTLVSTKLEGLFYVGIQEVFNNINL